MTRSINQPWGISDKAVKRFGETWASIDFVMNEIHENQFKTDPMNVKVGILNINNIKIPMTFKQVIFETTKFFSTLDSINLSKSDKSTKYDVTILNKSFKLHKHEITKISETLETVAENIPKGYQLGLYL